MPIAFVQAKNGDSTTSAAAALTLTGAPLAANTLVVVSFGSGLSATNPNFPVQTGGTFSKIGTQLFGAGLGVIDLWVSTVTGTATGVSLTPAGGTGCTLAVLEFSALDVLLDQQNSGTRTSTSPSSTGTITDVNANDLVLSFSADATLLATGPNFTAPGGAWSTPINVNTSATVHGQIVNYQIVSATGSFSQSQAWANSGTGFVESAIFSIKAQVTAGGVIVPSKLPLIQAINHLSPI